MKRLLALFIILLIGVSFANAQTIMKTLPSLFGSTQTSFTITTGGTFQQYLADNANRKGCTIQFAPSNTSTHLGYVFFGATADATAPKSFALQPGQSLNCSAGSGIVLQNAIQLSSSNNSDIFIVSSQ